MSPPVPSPTITSDDQWLIQERLLRLIGDEQHIGQALRLLLLLVALFAWIAGGFSLHPALFLPLWGGLLLLTFLAWRGLRPVGRLREETVRWWVVVGVMDDLLLVLLALWASGDPRSDLYILFALLALKMVFLQGNWNYARFLPFLFVPLYFFAVLALDLSGTAWREPFFAVRAGILFLVAAAALYIGDALQEAREQARSWNLRLGQRKGDLDTRTLVLTQTATNLATRVLELQTLQKGLKAINASLDLNVLLELLVDSTSEVFGGARCAIGLRDRGDAIRIAARSPGVDVPLEAAGVSSLEELAEQVVSRDTPILVDDAKEEKDVVTSAMAVPLVVDQESIGAIIVTRISPLPFTPDDQKRLHAFADQAALAVKNSRLYEQVERLYEEVKERSAELEAVLASIGDAVIVIAPDGTIRMTNPVANVILGLPDDIEPGTPLPAELREGEFAEHLHMTLANQSGDPLLGELTVHSNHSQGNRTYQALSAPLRDAEGDPRGVVTVLRDVTAAKELEQLKSNFVSTISHELKTPLHSIKGFVNIILSEKSTGPLTEVQRDFLSTVRDQTTRLERMILDLLEFSRLESGQIKLHLEPLDLRAVIETALEQSRLLAEERSVHLECDITEPLPIEGDRLRLEQVCNNLIANAIKFTQPGGRVTISGQAGLDNVEIVIRDTGIGIPREEQERIFERFYQVDASHTREYGGAGLGLAICKHIVERHEGTIWVESEVGRGSAFHFVLPRKLTPTNPITVDFSRLEIRD